MPLAEAYCSRQPLVAVHRDVANLAAGTKGARHELAVAHDAATNARAQRNQHHALGAARGALPELAQRGGIRIVHEGQLGLRERAEQRGLEPAGVQHDVGQEADLALFVNGPRHVQAHGDNVLGVSPVVVDELLESLRDLRERSLAHQRPSRDLAHRQKLPLVAEEPRLDAGPAHVNAQNVCHFDAPLARAPRRLVRPSTFVPTRIHSHYVTCGLATRRRRR